MSPPGIEPATLWFLARHLDHLAIEAVDYLCFKLIQYSEMTGYVWGVSKHVAIQYIKLIIVMPPFEKGGAYCVAPVGRSVCR